MLNERKTAVEVGILVAKMLIDEDACWVIVRKDGKVNYVPPLRFPYPKSNDRIAATLGNGEVVEFDRTRNIARDTWVACEVDTPPHLVTICFARAEMAYELARAIVT